MQAVDEGICRREERCTPRKMKARASARCTARPWPMKTADKSDEGMDLPTRGASCSTARAQMASPHTLPTCEGGSKRESMWVCACVRGWIGGVCGDNHRAPHASTAHSRNRPVHNVLPVVRRALSAACPGLISSNRPVRGVGARSGGARTGRMVCVRACVRACVCVCVCVCACVRGTESSPPSVLTSRTMRERRSPPDASVR